MASGRIGSRQAYTEGFITGARDGHLDAVSGCAETDLVLAADSLDSWGRGYAKGYRQGYAQGLRQLEAGR